MLRNKYRAFEIKDNQVSQTLVDGNLCSIAEFIRHCSEGSIITLHTMEGEPFLIGLSKMFVFCGDKAFLDRQLIPYLRSLCKCGGKTYESGKTGGTCGKDSEIRTAGGRYGLLRNKYRAFEIKDNQVSQTLVDGNLCSIAEFIRHCSEGSIITLHTMEGEPFLIGLSKMFVFCGDKAFLDRQLIPYLRSMGG